MATEQEADQTIDGAELVKSVKCHATKHVQDNLLNLKDYSSSQRLIPFPAWIQRFVANGKLPAAGREESRVTTN